MKTILLAALLVAAPVLAHDHRGDDDDYGYDDDDSGDYQYDSGDARYAPPDQGPSLDDFRNDSELTWNGQWIDTPEYGVVWRPTSVSDSWQPYLYGRWVWTNAGWAWVSEEPFGWAVYHYGRWGFSPAMGWFWIPGYHWAPAWVAWRWGDGYAGWCPLGPGRIVYQQPVYWVYVGSQHFLEPVRHYAIPRPRRQALPLASWGARAAAPPPVQVVERATGRTVRPLAVTDVTAPHAAQPSGGTVGFYRPRTAPVPAPRPREVQPRMGQGFPAGPGAVQRSEPRPIPRPQQGQPGQRPAAQPGPRQGGAAVGAAPTPRQGQPHAASPKSGSTPNAESKAKQNVPHAREQ